MAGFQFRRHHHDLAVRLSFLCQRPEERDEVTLHSFVAWLMSRCNPLFDGVAEEFVSSLLRTATLLTVRRGQTVYSENDKDHRAFVVLSGRLVAYSQTKEILSLGESGGVKQIQLSPPVKPSRSRHNSWKGTKFHERAATGTAERMKSSSAFHFSLQRSSSEPCGLDRSNSELLIPNEPEGGGKETYRVSNHLIRERTGSFHRAISPLVTKNDDCKNLGKCLGHISEGQVFGEMAFFTPRARRDMTVLVDESVVELLVIEAGDFYAAAHAYKREDLHEKTSFLEDVDIFESWDWSLKFHLAHNVEWEHCSFDQYVVHEGDPATHVYFIVSGQASLEVQVPAGQSLPFSLSSRKPLRGKQRVRAKELARLPPRAVFGLGEMLAGMQTYGMSLRACEQMTILRISTQKLLSTIERYHPEAIEAIWQVVKQQEEFHSTNIYAVDRPTAIRKQVKDMVGFKAQEKNQLDHFLPELKPKSKSSSSPTYPEIPRSPLSSASVGHSRHFTAWERGGSASAPSSPKTRRATTLSGTRRANTLSGITS